MAVLEDNESCKSCLFFIDGERMGICRRFPVPVNKSKTDWCGEYSLSEKSLSLEALVQAMIEPVLLSEPKKSRGRPKKS
jgi:hypothetical protein